ncbi:putative Lysozyme [Nostocoides japonicum T1-X7]|uniref:Putative Lysozyme n=1 Tax=Nostocoides japonicum T1-X7 TaxID=1194083 RepID=A0A077LV60_9MICO|nr:LysM peptidoglycan-binding domain-containing protein [Tetrasphaera japonica]CCH77818.1 putative Lysozyme [Tetrasphaera japonica T1-X7]
MNISASTLRAQAARASRDFPFIDDVERSRGLPSFLLYAVGSRESNLRNIKGDFSQRPGESSPRFHGFGVWQRDSGAFGVDASYLQDVPRQARDAADLLTANFRTFGRWDAAVAAYNCGPGNVRRALQQGRSVDAFTTGGDYSRDVLARRATLAGSAIPTPVTGGGRPRTYTVKAGDTLGAIALRFGTTVAELVRLNHIADPDVIRVGQVLDLPGGGGGASHRTVVVKAGDTLGEIAVRFHTNVAQLVRLNHLPDPDHIEIGQVLRVA